jgi:ATP-dependent 26S proteasome regulatory subunit
VPETRIALITGAPGTGKTRIAEELAADAPNVSYRLARSNLVQQGVSWRTSFGTIPSFAGFAGSI